MTRCERKQMIAPGGEKGIVSDDKGINMLQSKVRKYTVSMSPATRAENTIDRTPILFAAA